MKKYLYSLLVLALLGVGALYWLSDNIDELVASAITHHGSAMTQARVGVEHVEIQAKNGKGVISGLFVGNPKGFKTPHALRVERIELDVDLSTVAKDVTVVRLLVIDKPDVIYEKGEAMTNFDAIQKNIATYLGPQKKVQGGTRLIIEELTICNAQAQASAAFMGGKTISIPLPDISLKNVGKAKGGVTPGELGNAIAEAMKQRLSQAISFDRLMKSAGKALQDAGTAIKDLFK